MCCNIPIDVNPDLTKTYKPLSKMIGGTNL